MKKLKISNRFYRYYKANVKGNENIEHQEMVRKMTRNMLLAHRPDSEGYFGQMYQYGALWFVVKDNRIVWMKNRCKFPTGWVKDVEKYKELNKLLGIKEDETILEAAQ